MYALAGVVLHVDTRDSDALRRTLHRDIGPAMLAERFIVLRDLVALGQVGVKIILAGEAGMRPDLAVERERGLDRQFHRGAVQDRKRTRHPETDWAHIRIRRRSETRRAATEDLGRRGQLHVDL